MVEGQAAQRPKYVISTGYCPFENSKLFFGLTPEDAFKVGARLNDMELGPIGVELYPFQTVFPFRGVDPDEVKMWQDKYKVDAVRVHLEFAWDEEEHKFQASFRNDQLDQDPFKVWQQQFIYRSVKDARSGYGLNLAKRLGIGISAHVNIVLGAMKDKVLAEMLEGLPGEKLIENTINYNVALVHQHMHGPILYHPGIIAQRLLGQDSPFDGMLFAYDHLTDYHDRQQVDPLEVIEDELVQTEVRAIHIAGPNHSLISPHDSRIEQFVSKTAKLPQMEQPVQYVFDLAPTAMLRQGRNLDQRVETFAQTIRWFEALQNQA